MDALFEWSAFAQLFVFFRREKRLQCICIDLKSDLYFTPMAGRQLQRLLKEQLPAADEDEVSSSEEEEEEEPSRPAFNPFDLLTDGDSPEVRQLSRNMQIDGLKLIKSSFFDAGWQRGGQGRLSERRRRA